MWIGRRPLKTRVDFLYLSLPCGNTINLLKVKGRPRETRISTLTYQSLLGVDGWMASSFNHSLSQLNPCPFSLYFSHVLNAHFKQTIRSPCPSLSHVIIIEYWLLSGGVGAGQFHNWTPLCLDYGSAVSFPGEEAGRIQDWIDWSATAAALIVVLVDGGAAVESSLPAWASHIEDG